MSIQNGRWLFRHNIKQLLDEVFVICRIINVEVRGFEIVSLRNDNHNITTLYEISLSGTCFQIAEGIIKNLKEKKIYCWHHSST